MSAIAVLSIGAGFTARRVIITNGANQDEAVWIIHGPRVSGVRENTAVFANSEYLTDRDMFNHLESRHQKEKAVTGANHE